MQARAPASAEALLSEMIRIMAEQEFGQPFDDLLEVIDRLPHGPERDRLDDAARQGAKVRDLLGQHRRRERELQALFETARDLSSLRDSDDVLEAIVLRVRQLFGADSGYLALVDDASGEAFMRVTSGTLTTAIRNVRLRPGHGIGGSIIQSGQPYATSNYLADETIHHQPDVDEAVRRDGVSAIVGVPMRLGDNVIGALFVADRHEQSYGVGEMALLSSLADQASIVIENSRLFELQQRATRDLEEVNEQLHEHGRNLERVAAAHERLMPLALRRADSSQLCAIVGDIIGGEVVLVDADRASICAGQTEELDWVRATLPLLGNEDSGGPPSDETADCPGVAVVASRSNDGDVVWRVPVRAGEEAFGFLLARVSGDLTEPDVRTLERAAQTAALLQLMERQVGLIEQQVRGELLDDLLADREPDWDAFERRASRADLLDFERSHIVVVLAPAGPDRSRRHLLRISHEWAAREGGLAAEHAGFVVMLVPATEPDRVIVAVQGEISRHAGFKITAGVAGPASSAHEVRTLFREAHRCHRLLVALGRPGEAAGVPQLGSIGLILEGTSRPLVKRLLEEKLGKLVHYDRETNALLVETLESYFQHGQNPRSAASSLHVHPNTVYQRLERIDQVLGSEEWRSPVGALEMQLALQFHQLLGQIPLDELVGES